MAELGSGAIRQVTSVMLSRAACMAVAISHEQSIEKALTEYEKFRTVQDREIMSDFDKQLKLLFGDEE